MKAIIPVTMVFLTSWVGSAAPLPDLITCSRALEFGGEATPSGSVSVNVVPLPGGNAGEHTLRLCFRLREHTQMDWIDAILRPSPPIDLSAAESVRLWVRAEQETPYVVLKLVDPDNPGANHSLYESALTHAGKPLPAGQWVAVDVPLPEDAKLRDDLRYVGFYIPAADTRVPLNEDIVISIGRFPYTPPVRAPWPPSRTQTGDRAALLPMKTTPFSEAGPWLLVKGKDNQTDHLATFQGDSIGFHADASGWNEFLWSNPEEFHIKPSTTYRLQFDYSVLEAPTGGDGATFYSLVRAKGTIRDDVGWQRWGGSAGAQGRRTVTFTTHDMPDYYLNFGIRHHGAIRLKGIRLWEVPE